MKAPKSLLGEDAEIKKPDQYEHISNPIDREHLFGSPIDKEEKMHYGPNQFSPVIMKDKAKEEVLPGHGVQPEIESIDRPMRAKASKAKKD